MSNIMTFEECFEYVIDGEGVDNWRVNEPVGFNFQITPNDPLIHHFTKYQLKSWVHSIRYTHESQTGKYLRFSPIIPALVTHNLCGKV